MKTRGFLAAFLFVGLTIGISSSLAPGGKEPLRMLPGVSSKYKMVFASNRTGDFGIYVVNLDGSGLTKLMDRPDIVSLIGLEEPSSFITQISGFPVLFDTKAIR